MNGRLAGVVALLLCVHADASAGALQTGADLPLLEGKTLNGEPAALPRDAQGHATILVFGFTKAASKIARPWGEHCRSAAASKPGSSGVSCFDVMMLEDVPRAFRGSVEHGMRSGFPPELQRFALLVYQANDAWRERIGVTDEKTAYVIGCDKDGHVRGTAMGPFEETKLQKLLDAISPE